VSSEQNGAAAVGRESRERDRDAEGIEDGFWVRH
jgi:hypothetical protein